MEKLDVVCSFYGIVGLYNTILNHINCDHPDPEINNFESQSGCNSVQELQESSEVDETDNSKSNIFDMVFGIILLVRRVVIISSSSLELEDDSKNVSKILKRIKSELLLLSNLKQRSKRCTGACMHLMH